MKQRIQKAICALLALTMLLSIAPLTAFAATTTETILEGQTKLVQAYWMGAEEDFAYLSFTPTETATYVIYSTSECDPYLTVTADGQNVDYISYKDDAGMGENSMDFCADVVLEAGKTYEFLIRIYQEEAPLPVSVTLLRACDVHTDAEGDYRCDICYGFAFPSSVVVLELDKTLTVPYGEHGTYVSFTPNEDGHYIFTSSSYGDARATLFDSQQIWLTDDYDDLDGLNFKLVADLYAGETYYLLVENSWAETEVTASTCHDHNDETLDGYCDYCEEFIEVKREIFLWDTLTLSHNPMSDWVKFTPETSGTYILTSTEPESAEYEVWATLYTSDMEYLDSSTKEFEDQYSCYLAYEMEAGKTYYFRLSSDLMDIDEFSVELTLEGEKKPPKPTKPSKGSSSSDDEDETTKTTGSVPTTQDKAPLSIGVIVAIVAGAVILCGIGVSVGVGVGKKSKKADD